MTRTRTIFLSMPLLVAAMGSAASGQPATLPAAAAQTQPALTGGQWAAKAQEALASNDFVAAADALNKVVAAEPNNLNAALTLAECLTKIGDQARAREVYERCLKLSPNDWRIHFALGSIYLQRDYFPLARRYFEKAALLSPVQSRGQVLVNLALTYRGLHQTSDAMDRVRQAIALDPANMDARRILVGLYMEGNRLDDALAENRAALDLVGKDLASRPDDRRLVEQMLQGLGQEIDLLQRKLAAQPEDVVIHLRIVEALQQQGRAGQQLTYHRALEVLEPALQKSPGNPDLLLAHARLLHQVGRPGLAAEDLRKILTASPDNIAARQLLEKIELASSTSQPTP